MIAHLLEAYGQIWDSLFGANSRLGKVLKSLFFIALLGAAIFYAVKTEANKESREVKSFDVILDQNRQLLNILEAQNRLVTDRLNAIEQRQYQLQKEIYVLTDIQVASVQTTQAVIESSDDATEPVTAEVAATEQPNIVPEDVETRAAEIQSSIDNLKQSMAVEVNSEQSTTIQQTQQPTGN